MIATGIIRHIDDLGRIVIPRDVRQRAFGTPEIESKPMEIYYEKDGTIILKPYHVSLSNSEKISEIKKMLKEANDIGDSQEFGLSYTQAMKYLDNIEEIINCN